MMRSFREFLIEDIRDIPDQVIQQVLGLLTPEELASLDSPSPETNKKIFRRLAVELHPDKTGRPFGDVENAALRIFGKQEASNAKTFDRVKSLKQAAQSSAPGATGRPKTADEVRADAAAQRRAEWEEGTSRSKEGKERVKQEAAAREKVKQEAAARAKADAEEADRARVAREQADAAKKARAKPSGTVPPGTTPPPPPPSGTGRPTPPPPPPPISDTVSTTAAAGGNDAATQRFGRKAVDAVRKAPGQILQGAKQEAIAIGKDIAQGGFRVGAGGAPTSGLGKTLPIGAGLDIGVRAASDIISMRNDPMWQYQAPESFLDVAKSEAMNVGISTAIGAGIGSFLGPVGTGVGAVVGAAEGLATAPYGFAKAIMQKGYQERQNLENQKNYLNTMRILQQNNPDQDYGPFIAELEKNVADLEKNESSVSAISKGVDQIVGYSEDELKQIAAGHSRTPEQLRADAEAAFAERYPQGIPGGLAPGKSAEQVEKEAADMIKAKVAAGASPEELSKEFGWEGAEEEKNRQERIQKETELMASDPEKYGKMGETALSAAGAAKVVTDRALAAKDTVQASRERTAQQDAEYQAKLAAIEDAIAKKQAEKDAVTAYERQQQKDARAITTGITQQKKEEEKASDAARLERIRAQNKEEQQRKEAAKAEEKAKKENERRMKKEKEDREHQERMNWLERNVPQQF